MKISHLHPEHPTETVIQIEGLRQSVTLMHDYTRLKTKPVR